MLVTCVLKSGGDYTPVHVKLLREQVERHLPRADFVCLSDVPVQAKWIELEHDWPGWWSKLELCRPDVRGDMLYMDLDTAVVGPLDDVASVKRLTLLRDFYRNGERRPEGLQSSVMFLPEADRAELWAAWMRSPAQHMRKYRNGGDQAFMETLWLQRSARWQDLLPGQLVSYKVHCRGARTPPEGARVVCFHGRPRPWYANEQWTQAIYGRAA